MGRIYLDYAATTPVDPQVVEAMRPYWGDVFGNPSSAHAFGREARAAVDTARDTVARCLGARSDEIFFTSGGTESINLAIRGVVEASEHPSPHLITSAIEHHAVLDTCRYLERRGAQLTVLPVDANGLVDPEAVRGAITPQTVLVSIMLANNEIGTLQPIAEIARICREAGVLIHTDAVQAVGSIPVDVRELGVDLLSLSAHKFYGPKGMGVLYARKGTRRQPLFRGGGQERGHRPGTENVPGIVGTATALDQAVGLLSTEAERIRALRDRLIAGIEFSVPGCRLNGHPLQRLPNNAHFSVEGVESEALLVSLDLHGIAASGGSACMSGALEPSHVLQAIGVPMEAARGSVRFSLGRGNTAEEIDRVITLFAETVERLRGLSRSA